jgi:hypothetical protein
MHIDARQVDLVRVQLAGLDDLLHLDDADLAGHRRQRVEVARGLAKQQVAGLVGLPRLDQGQVRGQRFFHHVPLAVELAGFLALGHQGAVAGPGVERRDARAAGTQLLRQGALRGELQGQLAGQVLALELLVLAHVGGNHLADLPRLQQQAEAETVDTGVVADGSQVLLAAVAQGGDQLLGDAAQAEAADGDGHAVLDQAFQGVGGAGVNLVHELPLLVVLSVPGAT